MLVKINGKEVEVGPSRTHKQNCGCIGKTFQKLAQNSSNQPKLKINGREIDMNDPDDIQYAIHFCKIMGKFVMGFGIFFLLVMCNEMDWANLNFNEDIIGGLFAISIWVILGTIFFIFTPRALQKRLDELKKQGKVPSKY